jgi:glutathione S-transferase
MGTVPDMTVRLWHLPSSHYSEKVRWALEHKRIPHTQRTPLAIPHFVVAWALTRGEVQTFPVIELPGAGVVGDSTKIIGALEREFPARPLYPAGDADRARALELEEWFDEHLGRDVRALALHEVAHDPQRLRQLADRHIPAHFKPIPDVWARGFGASIRYRYGLDKPGAVDRARDGVARAFDHLERSSAAASTSPATRSRSPTSRRRRTSTGSSSRPRARTSSTASPRRSRTSWRGSPNATATAGCSRCTGGTGGRRRRPETASASRCDRSSPWWTSGRVRRARAFAA